MRLESSSNIQLDRCHCCGGDIAWVSSVAGSVYAVDPDPVQGGPLLIIAGRIQTPLSNINLKIYGPEPRYNYHLRTCTELSDAIKRGEQDLMDSHEKEEYKGYDDSHSFEVKNCNCGASMFFAPSEKQKQIPLQARPSPTGNIFLRKGVAIYVSGKNPAPEGAPLYTSHFADCPHAAQFRSKKD